MIKSIGRRTFQKVISRADLCFSKLRRGLSPPVRPATLWAFLIREFDTVDFLNMRIRQGFCPPDTTPLPSVRGHLRRCTTLFRHRKNRRNTLIFFRCRYDADFSKFDIYTYATQATASAITSERQLMSQFYCHEPRAYARSAVH